MPMNRTPSISVIMLTYNRAAFVVRMIESILSQTFTDFEYIIVDNGSTDGSKDICRRYAEQDKRIRFLCKPHGTIGSGRNAGLAIATGDFITFVDDDDTCEPDMLEFLYRLTKEHDADIAICGACHVYADRTEHTFVFPETLLLSAEEAEITFLQRKKFNTGFPGKMIKRRLFDDKYFAENKKFDDISFFYKIIAEARLVVCKGEPKYICTRHDTNNSAFTDNDKLITAPQLDEYFAAYRERTEFLCARFPVSRDFFQYSQWSFLISMCNKILSNGLQNCEAQLQYARDILTRDKLLFLNSKFIENFEKELVKKYL